VNTEKRDIEIIAMKNLEIRHYSFEKNGKENGRKNKNKYTE